MSWSPGSPASPPASSRPARSTAPCARAAKLVNEKAADQLQTAAEGFERLMELALPGRLEEIPEDLGYALDGAAGRCPHGDLGARQHPRQVRPGRGRGPQAGAGLRGERARRGGADRATARSTTSSGTSATTVSAPPCGSRPLSVSGLLREKLFTDRSVVLTSATLKLGGDFNGVGASLGLGPEGTEGDGRSRSGRASTSARRSTTRSRASCTSPSIWRARRGTATAGTCWTSSTELIEAAGGRTLGLFSSMRAAQARRGGAALADSGVPDPPPGRGDARRADQELRGRPEDLPVRHAVALAGRRRARVRAASWWSWTGSRSRARTTR